MHAAAHWPPIHQHVGLAEWSALLQLPLKVALLSCCRPASNLTSWPQGKLDQLERELLELNSNSERLQRSHAELVELQLVLEKAGSFFDDAQRRASTAAFDSRQSQSEGELHRRGWIFGQSLLRPLAADNALRG